MATADQSPALSRPEQRFGRFCLLVLIYIVGVVLWGAFVRATGSGAGCGSHWPLCNGEVVPRAPAAETVIEFTHRITSGLSLAAVVLLFFWSRRLFPRRHPLRFAAALSLVFLLVEALLGAGLVLLEYVAGNASAGRAVYLSAHLANTLLLLGMLTLTAWLARQPHRPFRLTRKHPLVAATLPVALLLSITGAIAALGDTLYPASSLGEGVRADFAASSPALLRLRMLHPAVAVLASLFLIFASTRVMRTSFSPVARQAAWYAVLLVVIQWVAGALNIALLAPVWMQLLHLFLADLLWIALVIMVIESVRSSASVSSAAL